MADVNVRANIPSPGMPASQCPYRGLMPYTEDDAAFFFGRDQDSRLIVDNLRAYPLCVLFGPSGVGKSSVLRAGVLRRIRGDAARRKDRFGIVDTATAYFSAWRDDPTLALHRVIAAQILAATGRDPGLATDRLDPEAVVAACADSDIDLLLILDQFEEYFLYHGDDDVGFTRILQQLLVPESRVSVLIAIREDALARLDDLGWALPGVFDHTLRLEHLSVEAAREAILQPVAHLNTMVPEVSQWSIDDELVDALLDQVTAGKVRVAPQVDLDAEGDQTEESRIGHGQIEAPFLQLVLLRLWNEEVASGSHQLRRATLERLGGAERIVREHLDRVVATFPEADHTVLAAAFGYLVTPGGSKIAHKASDLAVLTGVEEQRVRGLLQQLCRGGQLILREVHPSGDDLGAESRFEVFHDVLALAILDWRRRFLAERAQEEAKRAVVDEKEKAEAQARETHRRLRRARALLGVLALLLVGCVVLAIFVWIKAQEAEQSRLVTKANQELPLDPSTALGTALDAWATTDRGDSVAEAEEMLRRTFGAADAAVIAKFGDAPVSSAVFSKDGSQLLTAADDGHIRVLDPETGEVTDEMNLTDDLGGRQLSSIEFVDNQRSAIVTSGDGAIAIVPLDGSDPTVLRTTKEGAFGQVLLPRTEPRDVVVTMGSSGRLTAWDPTTGKRLSYIGDVDDDLAMGAISDNGDYTATWNWSGKMRMWETRTGSLVGTTRLPRHLPPFMLFVPNDDGRVLTVSATGKGRGIRVWDWRSNRSPGDPGIPINAEVDINWIGFDKAGEHLMIAGDKSTYVVPVDGSPTTTSAEGRDWVYKSAVSPDGHLVASANRDGTAQLDYADRSNKHPLWTFRGHGASINDIAFSPSGDHVVTAADDGTVRVWRVPERVVDWGLGKHPWLLDARFTVAGNTFVAGTLRGQVHVADASSGDILWKSDKALEEGYLNSVDPSPDGEGVVIAGSETPVPIVLRRDGESPPEFNDTLEHSWVTEARWSPDADNPLIVGGTYANEVVAWNAERGGKPLWLRRLGNSNRVITDLEVAPSGDTVIVASNDRKLRVLDVTNGKVLKTLPDVGWAHAVMVSADGRYAATASSDQTIRVWDLESSGKKPFREMRGATGTVGAVAFSHDRTSSRLAAVTSDGLTYIWDWRADRLLAELSRHSDAVNAVDFDPTDNSRVLTASDDGTAAVYSCTPCDLSADELEKSARQRLAKPPPDE